MDPQAGDDFRTTGYCEWRIRDFMPFWYDTDTAAYERVDRWYFAITYGDGFPPFVSKLGGKIHKPNKAVRIGIGADWSVEEQDERNRAKKQRDVWHPWKSWAVTGRPRSGMVAFDRVAVVSDSVDVSR